MSSSVLRLVGVGAGFVVMFLSGYWLAHTGKPYGTLIFTVHKLIALGLAVVLFLIVKQGNQMAPLGPLQVALVVLAGLFLVAAMTTGSLLSVPASKPMPAIVLTLNKIFPYLAVISTAVAVFFLNRR